jgi:general secretion pathway protein F
MPNFQAKIALSGKIQMMPITATSHDEALRRAKRFGRVMSLRRTSYFDMEPSLSQSERYIFLIKLATMVGSKVPMGTALDLMARTFTGNIRRVSQNMYDGLTSGMDFIVALQSQGKSFPPSIIELVRAGFSAGNAAIALREAANFEKMIYSISKGSLKEVRLGFIYMLASAALTWATMVYFGPMITDNSMFARNGVDTKSIEHAGWAFLYVNLFVVGVMVLLGLLATVGRSIQPRRVDRFISKIPYFSDMILAQTNYLTFYKMSLMIRAGVRMEETLDLAARDTPAGALKHDMLIALENIRRGKPWPESMASLDATDRASLLASPDNKDMANTLEIMAEQFRDLYIARINTIGPMLNILAALFLSIASAIMFGLTILPMLQLSAAIQ